MRLLAIKKIKIKMVSNLETIILQSLLFIDITKMVKKFPKRLSNLVMEQQDQRQLGLMLPIERWLKIQMDNQDLVNPKISANLGPWHNKTFKRNNKQFRLSRRDRQFQDLIIQIQWLLHLPKNLIQPR